MKTIILTDHIIKQLKIRKKISGEKAKFFLINKFNSMIVDTSATILKERGGLNKIIVGDEKIVYHLVGKKYTLITYIKKTECDKIEYKLLKIINYHENKHRHK